MSSPIKRRRDGRYVLRLDALVEASAQDLARWVGPTLDRYIAGPDADA